MRRLSAALLLLFLVDVVIAADAERPIARPPGLETPDVSLAPRTTGDTVDDPYFITQVPCTVTGTTTGFVHDYEEGCPFGGGTAPDVVYRYDADGGPSSLDIDLCYSSYDTKVYVYEDAVTPGAPIACNDDYYISPPCYTYASFLESVPVAAGHVYFIVVDGYAKEHGAYACTITDACCPPLPAGACCEPSGSCTMVIGSSCAGTWLGDDITCNPNPCVPVSVERESWGALKRRYR